MALHAEIETDGFGIVPQLIDRGLAHHLIAEIETLDRNNAAIRRRGQNKATYAIRNLLTEIRDVQDLADGHACLSVVAEALGKTGYPVRGILLDKMPEANWKVCWHQDCAIPLQKKIETEGFAGWSQKAGVIHAEAPASVLEEMVTLRIHLDDCGLSNGPLRVIPGSHREGVIPRERIAEWAESRKALDLCVSMGDAILMKPLLLHASAPAVSPEHRRVIHIEYAACLLPNGLAFATS